MKQKTLIKNSAYWIGVIAVGVVVGVSLQFVKAAWQEPSTTPPSSNMGAPINTGGAAQNKTGSLGTSGSFNAVGAVQGKKVIGTSQVCIGGDCRSAWPSGGGTGGWSGSGSGTAGRVTKWTASNKIGNSIIYDTGGRIGIYQSAPQARLDVNGGIMGVGIQSTKNISAVGNITTTAGTVSGNKVNATTSIYSAGTIKAATTVSGATVSGTTVCIGKACRTTWPSATAVVQGTFCGFVGVTQINTSKCKISSSIPCNGTKLADLNSTFDAVCSSYDDFKRCTSNWVCPVPEIKCPKGYVVGAPLGGIISDGHGLSNSARGNYCIKL